MNRFDDQLLRLKLCLGVSKDAEVAASLGMSRAAFSNRKQAGSFPDEQLLMLKRTMPGLDVMFVLTGERWNAGERVLLDAMAHGAADRGDSDQARSVARAMRNHSQALRDAAADPQVRELLGILICCDRAAIERVVSFAARLMGRKPIPFADREPATGCLLSAEKQAIKLEEVVVAPKARRTKVMVSGVSEDEKSGSSPRPLDSLPLAGKIDVLKPRGNVAARAVKLPRKRASKVGRP